MTSQSQPVTPVRVPKAATAYTPAIQDPDLRSQINTLLLREGHIEKIEQALHQALHAHPSNWPQRVSLHALTLLRTGECLTFPKLMERVLADIRRDNNNNTLGGGASGDSQTTATNPSPLQPPGTNSSSTTSSTTTLSASTMASGSGSGSGSGSSPEVQRKGAKNGKGITNTATTTTATMVNGVGGVKNGGGFAARAEGATTTMGLAVPQTVIDEGIRITRECLEQVCEVDE